MPYTLAKHTWALQVYLDAPHAATGPPPADVAPFFDPPHREWWRAEKVGLSHNEADPAASC